MSAPVTYKVTAVRDGRWWAILADEAGAYTQGRDLADGERMAREAIALLLNVPVEEVVIDLHVRGADALIDRVSQARAARQHAAAEEQAALADAVSGLLALGMSQRDAARLLGLSHQRVAQIAAAQAA